LRCVMHPLCRSLKYCAFLQTIAPLSFICFHSGLLFSRLQRAVIQRRSSLKAQGVAKKDAEKCCRAHFFLGPVRAYRNPLPAAKKVRAIEIAIAESQFCLTKCAPPIPTCLCVCTSSPQRSIKATYPPRPQGTKALEKGELACAAVSTSCLVLSSCSPQ
jgi:hypothetical protein